MSEIVIERHLPATPERVWELWTTPEGIERWWAPEGFEAKVEKLELEPGGELLHSLTATGPQQVEFMRTNGLPLTAHARKRFTEVERPRRLAYVSDIDFVPGREPYEHLTRIDLTPDAEGVRVVMTVEPMHDEEWTQRLVDGRGNELDNLARLIAAG
jgi:uncharacterized protein YndB with AHSA1/START domain